MPWANMAPWDYSTYLMALTKTRLRRAPIRPTNGIEDAHHAVYLLDHTEPPFCLKHPQLPVGSYLSAARPHSCRLRLACSPSAVPSHVPHRLHRIFHMSLCTAGFTSGDCGASARVTEHVFAEIEIHLCSLLYLTCTGFCCPRASRSSLARPLASPGRVPPSPRELNLRGSSTPPPPPANAVCLAAIHESRAGP